MNTLKNTNLPKPSNDDLGEFLINRGRGGESILASLGRIYPELSAVLETEIGKEILSYDLSRLDELFKKVYSEKAEPLELAEYRYLRDKRIPYIAARLQEYLVKVNKVKGG